MYKRRTSSGVDATVSSASMMRQEMKVVILFFTALLWSADAKSNGAGIYAVNPIQFQQHHQPTNNYHYAQPINYASHPQGFYQPQQAQQHGSNPYPDHFLVTKIKDQPISDPVVPPPVPNKPEQAPFIGHGQSFVIEPSYLLKPYRPPHSNSNYQPQTYQNNGPLHPVYHYQTPAYPPAYHVSVYQHQQQQPPYSSLVLVYSTPVLAYSTPLTSFEHYSQHVPSLTSSPVQSVAEPSLYAASADDSSEVNELGKRYVDGTQKVNASKLAELVIPKTATSLPSTGAAKQATGDIDEKESTNKYKGESIDGEESGETTVPGEPVTEIPVQLADDSVEEIETPNKEKEQVTGETSYDIANGVGEITAEPETETKYEVDNSNKANDQEESALEAGTYVKVETDTNSVAEPIGYEAPQQPVSAEQVVVTDANAVNYKQEEEYSVYRPVYRQPVIVEAEMLEAEEEESSEIQEPEVPSYPKGLEQVSQALYASLDKIKTVAEEKDIYAPVETSSEQPAEALIFSQEYVNTPTTEESSVEASSTSRPKTEDEYTFVQDTQQQVSSGDDSVEEVDEADEPKIEPDLKQVSNYNSIPVVASQQTESAVVEPVEDEKEPGTYDPVHVTSVPAVDYEPPVEMTKRTDTATADAPEEYQTSSIASVQVVTEAKLVPAQIVEAVASVEETSIAYEKEKQEDQTETPQTLPVESAEETSAEGESQKEIATPILSEAVTVDLTPVVAIVDDYGTPVAAVVHPVEESKARSLSPDTEAKPLLSKTPAVVPCTLSGLHYHTAALAHLPLDSRESSKEEERMAQTTSSEADDVVTSTTTTPYSTTASKYRYQGVYNKSTTVVQVETYSTTVSSKDSSAEQVKTVESYSTTAPKDSSAEQVKMAAPVQDTSDETDISTSVPEVVSEQVAISQEPSTSTAYYQDTSAEVSTTTTTNSPVFKRKFTPRSRFYTSSNLAPAIVQDTEKPSTVAPSVERVVIGKPTEVRKPINGKLYARTSSLPQVKPSSLPQVKILPSRLRIPTSTISKRTNDEQLNRRYFVGRPPVTYETDQDEEESDVY